MNIIIVGCGKVGVSLAERLSAEGHDLVMVDTSAKRVDEVSNRYDIMGVVGNGASFNVQMEAGVETADLFIAVTASDELNLLCCLIAKKVVTAPQSPASEILCTARRSALSVNSWESP